MSDNIFVGDPGKKAKDNYTKDYFYRSAKKKAPKKAPSRMKALGKKG